MRGSHTLRRLCLRLPLTLTLSPQTGRGNPVIEGFTIGGKVQYEEPLL